MLTVASIASAYRDGIVETGRETQFLFFVSFLVSFGFIRTSAHMIRAQVSWWPGNVAVGGTHVHHLVFGIIIILVVGYIGIAIRLPTPGREVLAVLFGIGAALTLDEFALWLNLEDVYWSEKGRASIDAVIIAGGLAGLLLVGLRAWLDVADEVEVVARAAIGSAVVARLVLSLLNAAKGKYLNGAIGIVLPVVGVISAFRLAKPNSLWARTYGPAKLEKAAARYGEGPPVALSRPS
jgi:hypothetical protein